MRASTIVYRFDRVHSTVDLGKNRTNPYETPLGYSSIEHRGGSRCSILALERLVRRDHPYARLRRVESIILGPNPRKKHPQPTLRRS